MDSSPPDHSHVPALDGVRGVAVLIVLLGHAWINPYPGNLFCDAITEILGSPWIGVDLFFVLSGFLITGILYKSVHAENYFQVFYFRRFLRIFPLYYGVLFALMLLTHPLRIEWHGRQWILLLYLQNLGVMHHVLSVPFSPYVVLTQFWSLAVEEQFYMIWPLILFLFKDVRKLIPVTIILSAGALLLRAVIVLRHGNLPALYTFTLTRADSLMIGALLSLLLTRSTETRKATLRAARFVLPIVLLIMIAMKQATGEFSPGAPVTAVFGYSLLAIFFSCFIAIAIDFKPVRSTMSNPVLRWFGKYSYGIYVFHPIFFASGLAILPGLLAKNGKAGPPTMLLITFLGTLASLLLAFASFHLYEKRFLALKGLLKYRFAQPPAKSVDLAPSEHREAVEASARA